MCTYIHFQKRIGEGLLGSSFRSLYNRIDVIVNECQAVLRWRQCATKGILTCLNYVASKRHSIRRSFFFPPSLSHFYTAESRIRFAQHSISHCSQRKFSHWILCDPRTFQPKFWQQIYYCEWRNTDHNFCVVNTSHNTTYSGADNSLARPGKKQATFPQFYRTWMFITSFQTVHHLSLP